MSLKDYPEKVRPFVFHGIQLDVDHGTQARGDCPICGMDLVKLEAGEQSFNPEAAETRTVITVAPEVIQNMGVRLGRVKRKTLQKEISKEML